jgi:hypothetical protein
MRAFKSIAIYGSGPSMTEALRSASAMFNGVVKQHEEKHPADLDFRLEQQTNIIHRSLEGEQEPTWFVGYIATFSYEQPADPGEKLVPYTTGISKELPAVQLP